MFILASKAASLLLGSGTGAALEAAVSYLRIVALFYLFCFIGNTFTGYFSGKGNVMVPFAGTLGHITLRVVASWALFGRFGLNSVAVATGIGWVCAVIFWGICKARDKR